MTVAAAIAATTARDLASVTIPAVPFSGSLSFWLSLAIMAAEAAVIPGDAAVITTAAGSLSSFFSFAADAEIAAAKHFSSGRGLFPLPFIFFFRFSFLFLLFFLFLFLTFQINFIKRSPINDQSMLPVFHIFSFLFSSTMYHMAEQALLSYFNKEKHNYMRGI